MAETSTIEWTDATWNPITGCTMVSVGCTNCYAMGLAATRLRNHPSRKGLTRESGGRAVWTGEVRLNEDWLDQPLRWRRQRRIFVCAHGDLFHEAVPDEWIDRVFAVMAQASQHTFQVLTKRPERARAYFAAEPWLRIASKIIEPLESTGRVTVVGWQENTRSRLPLSNVWLGTSIEDQATADARIPNLLATPAAKRFLSMEPLLGPVNLRRIVKQVGGHQEWTDALTGETIFSQTGCVTTERDPVDWVIVGGESGPSARPMHPDWARSLRDQCQAAGVPFFFKQWGEWAPSTPEDAAGNPRSGWRCLAGHPHVPKREELYPEAGAAFIEHKGKKAAGRLLDGRTWDEVPG